MQYAAWVIKAFLRSFSLQSGTDSYNHMWLHLDKGCAFWSSETTWDTQPHLQKALDGFWVPGRLQGHHYDVFKESPSAVQLLKRVLKASEGAVVRAWHTFNEIWWLASGSELRQLLWGGTCKHCSALSAVPAARWEYCSPNFSYSHNHRMLNLASLSHAPQNVPCFGLCGWLQGQV